MGEFADDAIEAGLMEELDFDDPFNEDEEPFDVFPYSPRRPKRRYLPPLHEVTKKKKGFNFHIEWRNSEE